MPLLAKLQQIFRRSYPDWQVTGLAPLGSGLEFVVYRAESAAFGPIAIRVPRQRWFQNDNDQHLDSRSLLQQEMVLARHLGTHGIPTAAVHALHLSDDLDFLISARIEHDGSPALPEEMGRLAAAVHRAPAPPDLHLVAMNRPTLAATLAERITRRMAVVERLSGLNLPLPPAPELERLLHFPAARSAILHMDLYAPNMLCRKGHILALVDWTNALMGDPALDLARTAEYGHLSAEFLAGYGTTAPFAHVPPVVERLYRMDTAIMLAVVFLSEAPNAEHARHQVARVQELHAALLGDEIMKPAGT